MIDQLNYIPLCKNMLQMTKSNARPDESVPEEPPSSTLRTPYKLIGAQIDAIKSLIKYNLLTDGNNNFNYDSHGDLQKQTKTHILARQLAIAFKIYWTRLCLYLGAD